jgi:hypothetical protein
MSPLITWTADHKFHWICCSSTPLSMSSMSVPFVSRTHIPAAWSSSDRCDTLRSVWRATPASYSLGDDGTYCPSMPEYTWKLPGKQYNCCLGNECHNRATNSLEQRTSEKTGKFSEDQKFPRNSRNPKFHYHSRCGVAMTTACFRNVTPCNLILT